MKSGYDIAYKSNRKVHEIDLQIVSASRLLHLMNMADSMKKCIFRHCKMRSIIHDDVIAGCEDVDRVTKLGDEFYQSDPPIGQARAIHFLMEKWRTPYIFHVEDDWEFELPVDLDRILWTMENNSRINCIFFNKQHNRHEIEGFIQEEVDFDGLKCCKSYHWPFLPGIWRADVFKAKWKFRQDRPEGYFNQQFGTHEERQELAKQDKFCVYMLGESEHPRYVRHQGENDSRLSWRKNRHKGKIKYSMDDVRSRAPWLPFPEEIL